MEPSNINNQFIETVRDCYLTQQIKNVIRIRGGGAGNILDLFSNDESIIEDVQVQIHWKKAIMHASLLPVIFRS